MKISFKNQIVLISGATRGIGKSLMNQFLKSEAKVIATGKSMNKKDFYKKFKHNNIIDYFQVDFLNDVSSEYFFKKISNIKKIDVCINNSGINNINYIQNINNEFNDILKVNLESSFKLTKVTSKIMKKNKYGKIINISSIWGKKSREKRISYSISKFGLNGLTVSSSIELARHNIFINSVSPGFVNTDLTKKNLTKNEITNLKKMIPLGRLANPEEIGPLVLFLSSKLNTYITGQIIYIDGGFINA